jgi:hypothetical protein
MRRLEKSKAAISLFGIAAISLEAEIVAVTRNRKLHGIWDLSSYARSLAGSSPLRQTREAVGGVSN